MGLKYFFVSACLGCCWGLTSFCNYWVSMCCFAGDACRCCSASVSMLFSPVSVCSRIVSVIFPSFLLQCATVPALTLFEPARFMVVTFYKSIEPEVTATSRLSHLSKRSNLDSMTTIIMIFLSCSSRTFVHKFSHWLTGNWQGQQLISDRKPFKDVIAKFAEQCGNLYSRTLETDADIVKIYVHLLYAV